MILAQPQEERRDRLANLAMLRRLVPYTTRTTVQKLVCLVVALALALASDHAVVAWLVLLPALMALGLRLVDLLAEQAEPHSAVLQRYEDHLASIEGLPRLTPPALLDCTGAVLMVVGAAWTVNDLPGDWRLLYLAAAAGFAVATCTEIFDDNTWYNPAVRSPRWQELDRILCGPQAVAVIVLIAWWAPWSPAERAAVAVIAFWTFIIPLRVAATQHLVADLEPLVEQERQFGTRFVIGETVHNLLPPLIELRKLAAELGPAGASVLALAEAAIDGVQDIPNQVAHSAAHQDEALGTVVTRLVTLAESAGRELTVQLAEALDLPEGDRVLASQAMRDLVGNAVTAGAARITLSVRRLGPRVMIVVTDDAPEMPHGVWKSSGTSSAGLDQRLREREGSLTLDSAAQSKSVTATWTVPA
jgi:signal transduction histidine kinase